MSGFLYLFIGGYEGERTPAEAERNMKEWVAWMDDMRSAGVWVGGHPLESGGKTIAGVDKAVTDGPFAETKEQVGGFIQIEADSMEVAVKHAKNCPIYPGGGRVEIRQIRKM